MKNAVAQNIRPLGIALMLATLMTSLIVRVPVIRAAENPMGRAGASPVRNLWPLDTLESAGGDSAQPSQADASLRAHVSEAYGKLPLSFELNQGQTDPQVKFLARGPGYMLFLTGTEAVLALRDGAHASQDSFGRKKSQKRDSQQDILRMRILGANPESQITGIDQRPGRSNYYKGNDPKKWQTNIANYASVRYSEIYPGIDMLYYGRQQELEYDFIVAPGADPQTITIAFEGVDKLALDEQGNLMLRTKRSEVIQQAPVIYQEAGGARQTVSGKYVLKGEREVGFEIGAYDTGKPLVIDPVLRYLSYLGGSGLDQALGIAVDAAGNAYVTGETISADFPTSTPHESNFGSLYVTKFNAQGTNTLYSTVLDGEAEDSAEGIAVDSDGNAYVVGTSVSDAYPILSAFQPEPNRRRAFDDEVVVSKLDADGGLTYSTYLGGNDVDHGIAIAISASRRMYITGFTFSGNFPAKNEYQGFGVSGVFSSGKVFVTVLESNGQSLVYSTALKGADFDQGNGIAVDAVGNAFVVGQTESQGFPVKNAFQPNSGDNGNAVDAFVAKINPTQAGEASLIFSTFLGGSGTDEAHAVAVTPQGRVHVTGVTGSTNFPLKNALDSTNQVNEAFVSVFSSTGSLTFSTFLGGSGIEEGNGIAVDAAGLVYVTGRTGSPNFPPALPFQSILRGTQDAFVTKIRVGGESPAIVSSSFLGGSGNDTGRAIAVLGTSSIYVAGITESTNLNTTPANVFQGTSNASSAAPDGFVTKIFDTHKDTIGVFRPSATDFLLRNSLTAGPADLTINFGASDNIPVAGDYNGDGLDTVGVFNNGTWTLRNFNVLIGYPTSGSTITVSFGQAGDRPVVGDWDGDGDDTVGVFRPSNNTYFLSNSNDANPPADFTIVIGLAEDLPIAGDWNADGVDTPGFFRPSINTFVLSNSSENFQTDIVVPFGQATDLPVAGDWDGDGDDTFGIFRPASATFSLTNDNNIASQTFTFGVAGDRPVVGDWNGKP